MIIKQDALCSLGVHLRGQGKRVVWSNGCFDLLHVGHIRALKQAKLLGDILIVGINSDESIRRIKGRDRPIVYEAQRAEVIDSLACVDYVVLFDENTPERCLMLLKPHIHCKGSEYITKPIPEAEELESFGGKLAFLTMCESISTTEIIKRIKSND